MIVTISPAEPVNSKDISTAKRSRLLAGLPPDVTREILDVSVTQSYGRGETIFLQGEPARVLRVILDGWVKLYRTAPTGGEAVIGVFSEGQSFGEAVVLSAKDYPVTGEAVTDCRMLQVTSTAFFELMRRRPRIVGPILGAMHAHLQELVTQIEQLKTRTGAQRLAEFMLELCPAETGSSTIELPYDKALIAGRLGMKPESLSRAFGRLKKVGVSINHSSAAIADVERLRLFADQDPAIAWKRED